MPSTYRILSYRWSSAGSSSAYWTQACSNSYRKGQRGHHKEGQALGYIYRGETPKLCIHLSPPKHAAKLPYWSEPWYCWYHHDLAHHIYSSYICSLVSCLPPLVQPHFGSEAELDVLYFLSLPCHVARRPWRAYAYWYTYCVTVLLWYWTACVVRTNWGTWFLEQRGGGLDRHTGLTEG